MKAWRSIAGLLGIILVLSAPVSWLTSLEEPGFAVAKLVVGALALALWAHGLWRERRGLISGRGGLHLWISAQWLGALLISGGLAVAYADHRGTAWDLTSDHVYTAAEETRGLLAKLTHPLKIEGYYASNQMQRKILKNLVQQLRSTGASIELEFVDPNLDPKRALAMLITAESPKIILRHGKREERVRLPTEQQLAQGLHRLLGTTRTLFVLRGHGEPELSGEDHSGFARLARELTSEGLNLAYLDLAKEGRIPAGASGLLWLHPKTPLLEQERALVSLYLDVGGRMLVAGSAGTQEATQGVLRPLGFELGSGVVVDPQVSGAPEVQGKAAAMAGAYTDHPVVARLAASGLRTLLVRAAPVMLHASGSAPGRVQPLMATSAEAWVEPDAQSQVWQRPKESRKGAILAAVWSRERREVEARRSDEARVGLLSDFRLMSNGGLVHAGNRALALNLINWLSDGDEDFAISASERRVSRLFLTRRERSRLRLLVLDGLPLMLLLPGLFIWQRRRTSA